MKYQFTVGVPGDWPACCGTMEAADLTRAEVAQIVAASVETLRALVGLADYCHGKLGKNPYLIAEFKAACRAAAAASGHMGQWMEGIQAARNRLAPLEPGPEYPWESMANDQDIRTVCSDYPHGPCSLPLRCDNCGTIITEDNVAREDCEPSDGGECEVCLYCGNEKCPACGAHVHCGGCI